MAAIGTVHPGDMQLLDHTGQRKSFRFFYDAVTAVSIAGLLTQMGTFKDATAAICLGTIAKTLFGIDENVLSNTPPSGEGAQIGSALLVQYQDATDEAPFSLNIPAIDYSKLVFLPGAGNAVAFKEENGASAEIIAWVTAFEALCSPPNAPTHNVTVTGMRYNSKRE